MLPAIARTDSTAAVSSVSTVAPDSVRALVARLAPAVERLRGRHFLRPVPVTIESDADAAAHFTTRLERFLPPERRRAWERAHIAVGLLPDSADVQRLLLEVLEEQAGGYYDPGRDAFVLLGDMPAAALAVLAVHELTHALDDQHFDIDSLLASASDDDDRGGAFGAVVEGSGMEVMTQWTLAELAAGGLDVDALTAIADSEAGRAERLLSAPDVVVRALIVPYVAGHAFLRHAGAESIATHIDRAFRRPPVSTEQILHPAKYWDADASDLPRAIVVPDLTAHLGRGYTLVGTGVFGELELAALTGPALDLSALAAPRGDAFTTPGAAGWGGDRWFVYERGTSTVTVVASLWDSPRDAREFATSARWPADVHVDRRGDAVVAVAGATPAVARRVARACLASLAPRKAR